MNKVVLVILLFLCGCVPERPINIYKVRQIRPDGVVHKEWIVRTYGEVEANYTFGGQSYLYFSHNRERKQLTPTGWLLDIDYIGREYAK